MLVAVAREEPAKTAVLRSMGGDTLHLPNAGGKVDLMALMCELAQRGINEVHVEAGTRLNGSLLNEDLVDELLVYLAPSVIGDAARGMFSLPALTDLSAARRLEVFDLRMLGADVRIRAWLAAQETQT